MLDYTNVLLSSKAYKMVKVDIDNNRCSHAYLFVSQDNNYLSKFAELVTKLIICKNEDENLIQNSKLKIEKNVHPDVKIFGEEKAPDSATIGEVIEQSNISPFEAEKKVFILKNVQDMNEFSQNKILKTLEEPTSSTVFLLCATATSRILPTILSRVKEIVLDELSAEQIAELLISNGIDKNNAIIYANCSNQNASFAEKLATNESFIEFFNSIVSCFFEINGSRDVIKFSSKFNEKNVDKEEFVNICMFVLRDINMILAKKEELVGFKNVLSKLKVIASMLNFSAVQELLKTCFEANESLHFNVNSTAVVDSILFKLAEVKVKCRR